MPSRSEKFADVLSRAASHSGLVLRDKRPEYETLLEGSFNSIRTCVRPSYPIASCIKSHALPSIHRCRRMIRPSKVLFTILPRS